MEELLAVITAKPYIFNLCAKSELFTPVAVYIDTFPVSTFDHNSITILKLIKELPPKTRGIRIIPLEHEREHSLPLTRSLQEYPVVFVNIRLHYKRIFLYRSSLWMPEYTFLNTYVLPAIKIIMSNWSHTLSYDKASSCSGPMSKTDDNLCCMWSCYITRSLTNGIDPITLFDYLNSKTKEELDRIISEFINEMKKLIDMDLFLEINRNEHKLCYSEINNIIDTVCQAMFNGLDAREVLTNQIERYTN